MGWVLLELEINDFAIFISLQKQS